MRLAEAGVAEALTSGPDAGYQQPVPSLVEGLQDRWPEPDRGENAPEPTPGKEAAVLQPDSSKARERLGWAPGWELEAGLDATVESFASFARGEDALGLTVGQIVLFAEAA